MTDKNRILIVDDGETVRRSYLRSLESLSCNVATAGDGETIQSIHPAFPE